VTIADVAGTPDRSFEIPLRLEVKDPESDPVTVVLQWAPRGTQPPSIADHLGDRAKTPPPAGRRACGRLGEHRDAGALLPAA